MELRFYEMDEVDDHLFKYVVIAARHRGKWIFCKNRTREWEMPGGKREAGEVILEAAKRELFEETGAVKFEIRPICAYAINNYGALFCAEITEFGDLPSSEIEKIGFFEDMPRELSFPIVHPKLFAKARREIDKKQRGIYMTLNSKDRAALRAKANKMPAIFHLGKGNISPEFVTGVREALEARELVKIDILPNCDLDVREAAGIVSERTGSEIVQIIGKKFVLYRKSKLKKEGII